MSKVISLSVWEYKNGYCYAHGNGITKRVGKSELANYKTLAVRHYSFWNDLICQGSCLQVELPIKFRSNLK